MSATNEGSMALEIRLHMLSDWHVGSGYGRPGDVDALVARDADDLPYVPAKTLTGILRDACEQAAFGLDGGKRDGAWSAWVSYIFGSQPAVDGHLYRPVSAALSVRSARLPEAVRGQLKWATGDGRQAAEALRKVVTFTKPGVQLDVHTGQAVEKCLRMEEMARGGATLHADAQIDMAELSTEQQHCVLGLLAVGCRLAERIGGKRRRGGGKVSAEMTIPGSDEKSEVAWLSAHSAEPSAPPAHQATTSSPRLTAVEGGAWSSYDVTLRLDSPVIANSTKKGNVVDSLDYLPGTYLLPVVSGALRKAGIDADSAIINGGIVVSNATIDVGGMRGLPVPWALFREKLSAGDGKTAWNSLQVVLDRQTQYKGLRAGYVAWDGTGVTHKSVKMSARMHNSIDDEHQRPGESGGGVYTYTAINAEQTFHTHVRISQSVSPGDGWKEYLKGSSVRLGSSKKDDYGLAHVVDVVPSNEKGVTEPADGQMTVWLTSDMLLRDERLRAVGTPCALQKLLEREFGCGLEPFHQITEADAPMNCVGRRRRTDSWQGSWGLPRPSLVGLCAGTCLIYKVVNIKDQPRFKAALARLQVEGIGERRAEGYGQVQFNHALLHQETVKYADEDVSGSPEKESLALSKAESEYLNVLRSAALTAEIRRSATAIAASVERRRVTLGITENKPTDSQFGNLRAVASTIKGPDDSVVMAWLEHVRPGKVSKDLIAHKWGEDAKTKLTALFKEREQVWSLLFGEDRWQVDRLLRENDRDKDDRAWSEAVRTLLDQCIRFEKRDREKSQGGGR